MALPTLSNTTHVDPAWIAHTTDDQFRWLVREDWQAGLLTQAGLPLESWRRAGQLEIVKHGTHRTVYRVALPDGVLYIKHYRRSTWLEALGHLGRPCASRREWRHACELARRGIATVEPLALGEFVQGGLVRDNFFISKSIAGSLPLTTFVEQCVAPLPTARRAKTMCRLAEALARMCAAMHRAGVDHLDLHIGNVLARPAEETSDASRLEPELFLIDLPQLRFSGPLGRRRSLRNLSMLNTGLSFRTSRTLRWRFWRCYLALRSDLPALSLRADAAIIERRARRSMLALFRRRAKRFFRENHDFHLIKQSSGRAHAMSEVPRAAVTALLSGDRSALVPCDAAGDFDRPTPNLPRDAVWQLDDRSVPVTVLSRGQAPWYQRFLPSAIQLPPVIQVPMLRQWVAGQGLLLRRIPTLKPLAVVLPRPAHTTHSDLLIIERRPQSRRLDEFLAELATASPQERACYLAQLGTAVGRLVAKLHWQRVRHARLTATSVRILTEGDTLEAIIDDHAAVGFSRRDSTPARRRELRTLFDSLRRSNWPGPTFRLRILRAYLGSQIDPTQSLRRWWSELSRFA